MIKIAEKILDATLISSCLYLSVVICITIVLNMINNDMKNKIEPGVMIFVFLMFINCVLI